VEKSVPHKPKGSVPTASQELLACCQPTNSELRAGVPKVGLNEFLIQYLKEWERSTVGLVLVSKAKQELSTTVPWSDMLGPQNDLPKKNI